MIIHVAHPLWRKAKEAHRSIMMVVATVPVPALRIESGESVVGESATGLKDANVTTQHR